MSEHYFSVTLFIAPDGDFIPIDEQNKDREAIIRPVCPEPSLMVNRDEMGEYTPGFKFKRYSRYTLKIPARPSKAWDILLRHVIEELEAKGDAPWRAGLAADE